MKYSRVPLKDKVPNRVFSTYNNSEIRHTNYLEVSCKCGCVTFDVVRPTPNGERGPKVASASLNVDETKDLIHALVMEIRNVMLSTPMAMPEVETLYCADDGVGLICAMKSRDDDPYRFVARAPGWMKHYRSLSGAKRGYAAKNGTRGKKVMWKEGLPNERG